MTRRRVLSRRTILRKAGAAVALPWLEAMTPRGRGAVVAKAPVRAAFVYVPNGVHMADWTPRTVGPAYELPPTLAPLAGVRDDLLVISGLALDPARAKGDGGGDHARAMAGFLTGRHPRKTDGSDLRAGVSVDQLAARMVGGATRFPSLELGAEGGRGAGECDHGYSCAYQSNLSWRDESTPVAKETNPRLVFDRLFGAGGDDEASARRARRRKSVLDFVRDDARRLAGSLGADDRRKVDDYLTGLREVERRLAPGAGAGEGDPGRDRPLGIPADYAEHVRLMADLLVLAFRADLTRVATLVFANDGSNRSYREAGVADGHHDLSHHGGDPAKVAKVAAINRFHAGLFAHFLERLKATSEGGGTLLDHALILYGSGISDGNAHAHDDLPILLAGRAGGTVATGRHVRVAGETPLTNLYLSVLDRLGAPVDAFGDSNGRLAAIDA